MFFRVIIPTLLISAPLAWAGMHRPACNQIAQACKNAGFLTGDIKDGKALWVHCINPLAQGISGVPGAKLPLPSIDPRLVTQCQAQDPQFGKRVHGGQVGSGAGAKKLR